MVPVDLSGQTALVTGAGQGLGAAIAEELARAGANVVVNYFADPGGVNQARAEDTAARIGSGAVAIEADVRDAASVKGLFDEAIHLFGRMDIVVNNAGILRDKTIRKMTDLEWQSVLDTNLTGVFHVCREAAERIVDGGSVVNIASISAFAGFFGQANYAAAKSGVVALTRVMSRELGKRGVRVNAVAPGVVLTEMGRSIPDEVRTDMLRQVPLGRFGEPDEIARVVLFLCSQLASYLTGQTLHVNGGWIA